jgi:hypothetical protein
VATDRVKVAAPPGAAAANVSAVGMIGGELLTGSDVDGAGFAVDATILALIDAAPPEGRVLLAGPHDPVLVDRLVDRGLAVDLLLRRLPDARDAHLWSGSRLAEPDAGEVRVWCGGIDRLAAETAEPYAAVLALDGTGRLCGPDSPPLDWPALAALLAGLVAPGGLLAVLVGNGMGLTRLAGITDPHADPPAEQPAGLPASRAAAHAVLGKAGLRPGPALAAYPGLLGHEALLSDVDNDALAALVAGACATGYAERPVLADPVPLAADAVRHGLGADLAPAWLLLASRGAEPPAVPEIAVLADRQPLPYWSVPQLITRDDAAGLRRTPLPDPVPPAHTDSWPALDSAAGSRAAQRALGHLCRDPAALAGPLPAGRSLEDVLLSACAAEDLAAVRATVRRYLRWLRDGAAPGPWRAVWSDDAVAEGEICPPAAVLSTLDTVLDSDGTLRPADPSWSAELAVPVELVLIRALQRFGYRLLAAGHPHPWPAGVSPDRLAVTLAATAGVTVSPRDLAAATAFAVYLEGPLHDATGTGDADRYARLRQRWAADPAHGTVPPRGYREAVATIGTLAAELTEARAQIRWLDSTIADRDRQLSAMGALRKSVTYRIGYLFTFPYHIMLRLLRRELRRWRQG